jgi:hypothetical protein
MYPLGVAGFVHVNIIDLSNMLLLMHAKSVGEGGAVIKLTSTKRNTFPH